VFITKDILLKELGEKEGYNINDKFRNRLKDRIYTVGLPLVYVKRR
jgi:hypothetical protein